MPEREGPLAGIVIIDLTRVLAGPYCTMVLSDLGARVIKIEVPEKGDDARHIGPFINGKSAYFSSLNRDKESLALDLKAAEDRVIFDQLLERADVLVENYRPGVMDKLGYGWDAVHERFPKLIYAAASGFGQTGPYRTRAAYDMVVQAMGGIMSVTGQPGAPPTRVGSSIGDITAGLFTAIGINAALFDRTQTGKGVQIDVSMLDCQLAILENAIVRYAATGTPPGPIGARHPSITPFAAYRTADGYIVIAAGNDALFAKLAGVLDRPDLLESPGFKTNDLRTQNVDQLTASLETTFSKQPTSHWLAALDGAGVPCGPINNVEEALNDPQIRARNMVVSLDDPEMGRMDIAGNPIKISGFADPTTRGAVPELDGNREALLAWLKRSQQA
ncbi:MAG: CaiB/BaiF CoA transferase family protein [Alphaproteobacteria bacterium]